MTTETMTTEEAIIAMQNKTKELGHVLGTSETIGNSGVTKFSCTKCDALVLLLANNICNGTALTKRCGGEGVANKMTAVSTKETKQPEKQAEKKEKVQGQDKDAVQYIIPVEDYLVITHSDPDRLLVTTDKDRFVAYGPTAEKLAELSGGKLAIEHVNVTIAKVVVDPTDFEIIVQDNNIRNGIILPVACAHDTIAEEVSELAKEAKDLTDIARSMRV